MFRAVAKDPKLFDDHIMKDCDVRIITKNGSLYTTSKFLRYVSATLNNLLQRNGMEKQCNTDLPVAANSTLTRMEFIRKVSKEAVKTSAQVFCYTFPRGEYEIKTVDPRSRKSKGTIVEGDNSSIEIEAPEGLTSENVKIALTFYRPKYYAATSITSKSNFDQLLQLSTEWGLEKFKKMLERFLIKDYEYGFTKGFLKSSKDIQIYKDLLLLAETYNLRTLHALFMDEKPWLGDGREKFIKQFADKTRYEIMRNSIIHEYRNKKSVDDAGSVELSIIFNFFDLILYGDRTVDLSAKKVFDDIWEHDGLSQKSSNQNGGRRISNEFTVKGEDDQSYAIFVVEGRRLYIDLFLVYDNSPVLTNRLQTAPKEGEDIVLELPGKSFVDVVTLLKFLKNPLADLMDADVFKLTNLCDEYQIEWLTKEIEKYLEKFIAIGRNDNDATKSKVLLQHLKLTGMMGFQTATRNLVDQITDPFYDLQMLKGFHVLHKRTQILVALKRLRKLLDFDRKLNLYLEENGEHGFPSIIEKHLRDNSLN